MNPITCKTRLYVSAALALMLLAPQAALGQKRTRVKEINPQSVEVEAPAQPAEQEAKPASLPTGVGATTNIGTYTGAGTISNNGTTANNSSIPGDGTTQAKTKGWSPFRTPKASVASGPLIISEFRWNGTNGANDEFIEIYNISGADYTINAAPSTGFGVAASDGALRFIIPNGTVIPNRGHYLGCNSVGYSVTSYPAGNGTTATCDATYTTDIPINTGIALFNTANPLNFTMANRLDAVGASAEGNAIYKEGTGVRNLNTFAIAYSYFRRLPGGCIGTDPGTVDSNCTSLALISGTSPPSSSIPQDTDNNRADFLFTDTNGTQTSSEASQQRLGAPGPENLSSPIMRGASFATSLIDPCAGSSASPNRVRDLTNDPGEPNDTFGSLFIRRRFTNNTGANVTRLRFRIVDITTFPSETFSLPPPPNNFCGAPGAECAADLRALTSTDVIVLISAGCGGGSATVRGTTLEQAASPNHQPNGGAFNSSLSAGIVTLGTPLGNGLPLDLQFRFGVQQQGRFRVYVIIEALP